MKPNQKKALHQKSITELKLELLGLEKELIKARLELSAQKLEDTSKPKRLVKNVARIKTIISEKEKQGTQSKKETEK